MRILFFILMASVISFDPLFAQQKNTGKKENVFDEFTGTYLAKIDSLLKFKIKNENGHLMLEVVGQGKVDLSRISATRFRIKRVTPEITVEFIRDSLGNIRKFLWMQEIPKLEWIRISDSTVSTKEGSLDEYAGKYKLNGDTYQITTIKNENQHLTFQANGESKHELLPLSKNDFIFKIDDFSLVCKFMKDPLDKIQKMVSTRKGPIEFIKTSSAVDSSSFTKHVFGSKNGFTAADTLRGMLTPLRTCYDVLFYDLNVVIDPERKSIRGNNIIRLKAIQSFDKIQVDLFANMKIEKILFHNQELSYTRKFDAVFIQFPNAINKGDEHEINIYYSGNPQLPDPSTLTGGFLWFQDKKGNPWIESVTQGSGASLWWPCKDHLSDKPDSMKINITVPRGMTDISNGRLISKTDLPENLTRFDWYVSYPITNYNVVVNIGDYAHYADSYINHGDTLAINYYYMRYNEDKAKQIFAHVKPMLALYEKDFGQYPFMRDGFTLMESLYPMEHQGAVSIGSINNPVNSDNYDSADLIRTAWHESGHEWWGNSITCKDMADLWIHEAFATYAEVLNYETFYGKEAALKYLKSDAPKNEEPIIGFYDVNDFHLGDMYTKGALTLHTLRNIIDNDSLWFSLLKGIQKDLRYQSITTEDMIGYVNQFTKKDFTYFFDQYLRHTAIPELLLRIKKESSSLNIQYRWKADVNGFNMPVKVTTTKNNFAFIYPTQEWQNIDLQNMNIKDFKVDTDEFYIAVKNEP